MESFGEIRFSESTAISRPKLARRSKGCLTCRLRKVRCDGAKPVCDRCRTGFHTCQGYGETCIFKNSGIKPSAGVSLSWQSVDSPIPSAKGTSTAKALPKHQFEPEIVPELSPDAFKDNFALTHLLTRFGVTSIGPFQDPDDAPTLSSIFFRDDMQSSAYRAGLAVAQALLGRMHGSASIVCYSTTLYGRALRSVSSNLSSKNAAHARHHLYQHMWSSLFFILYEAVMFSAPRNYLEHCRGLHTIVYSLGPRAFQSPAARTSLEYNRILLITASVISRQRTFLEETEWKSILWDTGVRPRSFRVLLDDVYSDIPGYMETVDRLSAAGILSNKDQSDTVLAMQSKITEALSNAEVLRAQWEARYPNVCDEAPPAHLKSGIPQQSPFRTVLRFTKPERAFEMNAFNTIRLLLLTLADRLGISAAAIAAATDMYAQSGTHTNPLVPPGSGCRVDYAVEICRTVEYMMDCEWDILGALALLHPLAIASHELKNGQAISAWIDSVLERISLEKGFKIAEHVRKIYGEQL